MLYILFNIPFSDKCFYLWDNSLFVRSPYIKIQITHSKVFIITICFMEYFITIVSAKFEVSSIINSVERNCKFMYKVH